MTDNDSVLELYDQGISAHDLRSPYVKDRLENNPFIGLSRDGIERAGNDVLVAAGWFPEDTEQEFWQLDCAREALEDAESKAIKALSSGRVIGLGLTDAYDLSLKVVPRLQWPFLTMDFEKDSASGAELDYVGLRFIFRDELTEEQVQGLKAISKSTAVRRSEVTQIRSLSDLNISTWEHLHIRFVKNKYVEVGGPEKKLDCFLGDMGLLDRTTGQENKACIALLQMANGAPVTTNKKHTVSNLRQLLRSQFGLSTDPFHIERGRYVPNFKILDNWDAADRRAKKRAVHVPFNDEQQADKQSPDRNDQDGYSFEEDGEMKNDEASAWLNKEMSG
jgi:hypothetical protein